MVTTAYVGRIGNPTYELVLFTPKNPKEPYLINLMECHRASIPVN
jgi:hypothetical protein